MGCKIFRYDQKALQAINKWIPDIDGPVVDSVGGRIVVPDVAPVVGIGGKVIVGGCVPPAADFSVVLLPFKM